MCFITFLVPSGIKGLIYLNSLNIRSEILRLSLMISGIAAFADSHSCVNLAETATNYAVYHFVDVVQGDEFLKISGEQLNRLISDDALNVQSEERVFEAVVAWIQHDKNSRMVNIFVIPLDTGRKLNVYKTFRRCPGPFLNISCTFNLRPVYRGIVDYVREENVEENNGSLG